MDGHLQCWSRCPCRYTHPEHAWMTKCGSPPTHPSGQRDGWMRTTRPAPRNGVETTALSGRPSRHSRGSQPKLPEGTPHQGCSARCRISAYLPYALRCSTLYPRLQNVRTHRVRPEGGEEAPRRRPSAAGPWPELPPGRGIRCPIGRQAALQAAQIRKMPGRKKGLTRSRLCAAMALVMGRSVGRYQHSDRLAGLSGLFVRLYRVTTGRRPQRRQVWP